ncbi:MAG TPA: gliding motility-associated C-terminal domain-containing protein, partial [Bacteroidales bacterium]|nr:gliding motility-associated C-terminal domain-containing protein [Bacteroidales bacterium]
APYTYTWTGTGVSTGSEDQTALAAGTYSVTVTDAASCSSAPLIVTLTQPSALTGSIVSQTDVSVFGGNNGSVEVAGSGGIAPYQFKLGSGASQASGIFGALSAGSYTVTVQDANLCTFVLPVTITQPTGALSGSITSQTNVTCFGTLTGSVTVAGSGGLPPYDYQINGGTWQSSGTFGSLGPGNYTVTVRDAASTTSVVPVTISSPTEAVGGTITAQNNVLCFGGNNGNVTAAGTGGIAPYLYRIDGGTFQVSGSFSNLTAGTHTITVMDSKLCTFDISAVISGPALALSGSISAKTNVTCFGAANGSVTISGSGGTTPYEFSINGGAFQSSGIFSGLLPGSHTVTLRDANACSATVPVLITEPDAIVITSSATDVLCPDDPEGAITLTVTGGTQPYTVIWSDGVNGISRSGITDGTYSAVITDLNGCAGSVDVTVGVIGSEDCIEIPEIITPNGDGYNDTWKIRNIDMFPNAEVVVFNRWGKKVFESRNILAAPWDGTLKGKALPTDSYHYILDLKNGSKPRSGVISIIK